MKEARDGGDCEKNLQINFKDTQSGRTSDNNNISSFWSWHIFVAVLHNYCCKINILVKLHTLFSSVTSQTVNNEFQNLWLLFVVSLSLGLSSFDIFERILPISLHKDPEKVLPDLTQNSVAHYDVQKISFIWVHILRIFIFVHEDCSFIHWKEGRSHRSKYVYGCYWVLKLVELLTDCKIHSVTHFLTSLKCSAV